MIARSVVERGDKGCSPPLGHRFIFHMAFCGSSLLSNLIASQTPSLVLREPNILVNIANNEFSVANGSAETQVQMSLKFVLNELSTFGNHSFEGVVIKPSNWVNTLLPTILSSGISTTSHALFVTITEREFLRTVFFGGRSRMEFILRFSSHIVNAIEDGKAVLTEAIGDNTDPFATVARLTSLSHKVQTMLFEYAANERLWKRVGSVDFSEITSEPEFSLMKACDIFEINRKNSSSPLESVMLQDAKKPNTGFSKEMRNSELQDIEAIYGDLFNATSVWANDALANLKLLIRWPDAQCP